ncbi:unnamed protein product [Nippostrongylus brasiliensis]|uniref:Transposase n=1 Tax=Nippostrongylus brasiliensis TaxID=27835 RepID=A0A0N4XYC7_NIPBR|nr:unnamed protein product [Nippostrongylus brasiliensis]
MRKSVQNATKINRDRVIAQTLVAVGKRRPKGKKRDENVTGGKPVVRASWNLDGWCKSSENILVVFFGRTSSMYSIYFSIPCPGRELLGRNSWSIEVEWEQAKSGEVEWVFLRSHSCR